LPRLVEIADCRIARVKLGVVDILYGYPFHIKLKGQAHRFAYICLFFIELGG